MLCLLNDKEYYCERMHNNDTHITGYAKLGMIQIIHIRNRENQYHQIITVLYLFHKALERHLRL